MEPSATVLPKMYRVVLNRWEHSSGSRLTYVTWQAVAVQISDGAVAANCGHVGHKSQASATACGLKLCADLMAGKVN